MSNKQSKLDEDFGFFELADSIWAEADKRRAKLKRKHGKELGNWFADIYQYGAAWGGDAWQEEARRIENHPAFAQIGDSTFWDNNGFGTLIIRVHIDTSVPPDEVDPDGTQRWFNTGRTAGADYQIAAGRITGAFPEKHRPDTVLTADIS